MSESTLRRKAAKIGYRIAKGKPRFFGSETGYMVLDELNHMVGGYNNFCYMWTFEDVVVFLKEEYEALGLTW